MIVFNDMDKILYMFYNCIFVYRKYNNFYILMEKNDI